MNSNREGSSDFLNQHYHTSRSITQLAQNYFKISDLSLSDYSEKKQEINTIEKQMGFTAEINIERIMLQRTLLAIKFRK